MSYILDALRKADRQRQRAARVPTLDTVHQPAPTPLRRWWPWAIAAVLVLNAAVLVVVLRPDRSVVAPPAVESQRDLPPRELAGRVAPEAAQRSPDRPGERTTARAAPSAPPATASAVPTPTESAAVTRVEPDWSRESSTVPPPQPPVPPARAVSPLPAAVPGSRPSEGAFPAETMRAQRPPGSAPAEAAARAAEPATPAGPGSAAAASVLPDAMSKMSLDVLVYAEREVDRFVFINGRKYVEGQRVDGKFLLEAITEEGAILSHEGQRLLLSPRLTPYPPSTRRGVGR